MATKVLFVLQDEAVQLLEDSDDMTEGLKSQVCALILLMPLLSEARCSHGGHHVSSHMSALLCSDVSGWNVSRGPVPFGCSS